MIPVHDLFESHLNVTDLQRSMSFFGQTLGLELAEPTFKCASIGHFLRLNYQDHRLC